MALSPNETYPRPDFVRTNVQWQSLNGPWDFLFDDEDVGLSQKWHLNGIPDEVAITKRSAASGAGAEADSITQKIAAGTQNLIKNNFISKSGLQANKKRTIKVPYVFQCPASGINERGEHEVLWYQRAILDPRPDDAKALGDRVLVRFGAVDYEATVWLDGRLMGSHRGGHVPFDVDITDALDNPAPEGASGNHRLTLRVYDSAYDLTQPRGKQYWGAKPESIFYTPSSGVWQNVWIETVPSTRLADSSHGTILRSNDIESGNLHARVAVLGRGAGHEYKVEVESHFNGQSVSKTEKKPLPKETSHVKLDVNMQLSAERKQQLRANDKAMNNDAAWRNCVVLWSPDYPMLYNVTLRLYDSRDKLVDEVSLTTGMRSLQWTTGDSTFRLNGKPLFQSLVLDQGYWPETFMTPPSANSLKEDIELSKAMGFNGCRKHQKVEDPLFNHYADHLGYLVWGEIANAYSFSEDYTERFDQEWMEAVRRDINHPCIVTWTPVNESWAYTDLKGSIEQRDHIRALYYMTKTLDPTRSINDNCGWEHVMSDLTTFHDYADAPALTNSCASMTGILADKADRPVFLRPLEDATRQDAGSAARAGAPVLCTEFGGVNIAPGKGAAAGERDWGYTTASDPEDLLRRIEALMMGVVNGGHICGFVYTQLADIEQEVNGLYSFDRKAKLDAGRLKAINLATQKAYYDRVGA